MARALVIFLDSAGIGGENPQRLSYAVVFRGSDVSDEIATGQQIQFVLNLQSDFDIAEMKAAIVIAVETKAAELGLTIARADIRLPSYETGVLAGDAIFRLGIFILPWEWFKLKLR